MATVSAEKKRTTIYISEDVLEYLEAISKSIKDEASCIKSKNGFNG
jgi:cell division protein ZapA (FtsZ GTPase activity inhibitor)